MTNEIQENEKFLKEAKAFWLVTSIEMLFVVLFAWLMFSYIQRYTRENDPMALAYAILLLVAVFMDGCRIGHRFKREYLEN